MSHTEPKVELFFDALRGIVVVLVGPETNEYDNWNSMEVIRDKEKEGLNLSA